MKTMKPRLCSFVDPASCLGVGMPAFVLPFLAARLDVPTIMSAYQPPAKFVAVVSFVRAQMLRTAWCRLRTMNRHAVECWQSQGQVVPVRPRHRQSQHHAADIGQHGSLYPQLASIGRVFPGFFPHPAVPWSKSCRAFANASQSPCDGRTPLSLASTACGTHLAESTLESNDANCCPNRTPPARLSTGNRCASHNRCHWQHVADPTAGDHRADAALVSAVTCSGDAKSPRATDGKNLL